jgi:hypothetical protein
MPASLEDAMTALEGQDNGEELSKAVLAAIDGEKQKGQEARTKANNEAKNLRDRLKAAEVFSAAFTALGFDPEGDVKDPNEFADTLLADVEKAKKGDLPDGYDVKTHPDYKKVVRELTKLTDEHQSTTGERDKLQTERNHGRIRAALGKALKDDKGQEVLFATDKVINELLHTDRVRLTGDNDVVFVDGESEIDFDSGMKALLEENKSLLRNPNRPGGGSGGAEGSPGKSSQDRTAELRELRKGGI